MITVIDLLRYNIHKCSSRIHEIKNLCNKYTNYINPKDKYWKEYSGLKREVSFLLTTLAFYKNADGNSDVSKVSKITAHMNAKDKSLFCDMLYFKDKIINRWQKPISGRIAQYKFEIERGVQHIEYKWTAKGYEKNITYVPKDFSHVEKWKVELQARIDANIVKKKEHQNA
jgi:hypothetical protein